MGGRWVKGWIEIGDYFPIVYFERGGLQPRPFNLSEEGIDQQIFQLLSEFIPAGGHLMFAYEVSYESPFHHETLLSLMRGIPPVCTAQGQLLFRSGFRVIKDWYLAEGGHEGPRKLWGEKPSNENESRDFDLRTFLQLLGFLAQRPNPDFFSLEIGSRTRASVLLGELNLQLPLSRLGEEVSRNYHDSSRVEELEEAAHRTCQHITQFVGLSPLVDERTKGKLSEISDACSAREVDVPPA